MQIQAYRERPERILPMEECIWWCRGNGLVAGGGGGGMGWGGGVFEARIKQVAALK